MSTVNPFMPLSGSVPRVWAGRESILFQIDDALQSGMADPYLSTIFVGPRGTGKTSLLTYAAQKAHDDSWVVAACLSSKNMLQEILDQASFDFKSHYQSPNISLSKLSITGPIGLELDLREDRSTSFITQLSEFVDKLENYGLGLLITVDDINPKLEETETLVAAAQYLQSQGKRLALFMAALPEQLDSLLNGKSTSFLRRAMKYYTSNVSDVEVASTLSKTVKTQDKSFSGKTLERATTAVGGYPYLIQFIGYWCFKMSGQHELIDEETVDRALAIALPEYEKNVLDAALSSLSEKDISIIQALSDGPKSQTEIANALKLTRGYVSVYKNRLLGKGILYERPDRRLAIALPHLDSYIKRYVKD